MNEEEINEENSNVSVRGLTLNLPEDIKQVMLNIEGSKKKYFDNIKKKINEFILSEIVVPKGVKINL